MAEKESNFSNPNSMSDAKLKRALQQYKEKIEQGFEQKEERCRAFKKANKSKASLDSKLSASKQPPKYKNSRDTWRPGRTGSQAAGLPGMALIR